MDLPTVRSVTRTRWFSPENPSGEPGAAGLTNRGAKGRAFVPLAAGDSLELLALRGNGTIRRIWLTLSESTPEVLEGVRVEAIWDDAAQPAVSVPLGAFFGAPLGRMTPFESALFSSPEGRSLSAVLPMPFRSAARVVLVNDSGQDVRHVFYEVAVTLDDVPDDALHLHAAWRRDPAVALGRPFLALPEVRGCGRLLGLQLGVRTDPGYGELWWGEGEVRMRIDRPDGHTLSSTGLEDYVATAWGMGSFAGREHGCPVAQPGSAGTPGAWSPYRLHLSDPVWFTQSIEVTVDAIGGGPTAEVLSARTSGAPVAPITIDVEDGPLLRLLDDTSIDVTDPRYAQDWTNFFRSDDYSATVWFYLDRP